MSGWLDDRQPEAVCLASMLRAVAILLDDGSPDAADAANEILSHSIERARRLSADLDSVNRPDAP